MARKDPKHNAKRAAEPGRARTGAPVADFVGRNQAAERERQAGVLTIQGAGPEKQLLRQEQMAVESAISTALRDDISAAALARLCAAAAVAPGTLPAPSVGLDKADSGSTYCLGGTQPTAPELVEWVEFNGSTYFVILLLNSLISKRKVMKKSIASVFQGSSGSGDGGRRQKISQASTPGHSEDGMLAIKDDFGVVSPTVGGQAVFDANGVQVDMLPRSMHDAGAVHVLDKTIAITNGTTHAFALPAAGMGNSVTVAISFTPSDTAPCIMRVYTIKDGSRTMRGSISFNTTGGSRQTVNVSSCDLSDADYFQATLERSSGSTEFVLTDDIDVTMTTTAMAWVSEHRNLDHLNNIISVCYNGVLGIVSPVGPLTGAGAPQGQLKGIRLKGDAVVRNVLKVTNPEDLWSGAFVNAAPPHDTATFFELKGIAGTVPYGAANAEWHDINKNSLDAGLLLMGKIYDTGVTAPPMAIRTQIGYNFRVKPGTANFQMEQQPVSTRAFDMAVELDNRFARITCNPKHDNMVAELLTKMGVSESKAATVGKAASLAGKVLTAVAKVGSYALPLLLAL